MRRRATLCVAALLLGGTATAQAPAVQHKRVGHELRRLHLLNHRLREAVTRYCCNAPTPALASIAACESGGRPWAISPGGTYRGKYQFDFSTWRGVGGSGDPAAAPEPEQDYRAWLLYERRGAQPWPVCGRE